MSIVFAAINSDNEVVEVKISNGQYQLVIDQQVVLQANLPQVRKACKDFLKADRATGWKVVKSLMFW